MTTVETLCRYVDDSCGVRLVSYPVIKRTPRGCWISMGGYPEKKKFVLDLATKKFAYPNEPDAKVSFFARKRRQLAILGNRISNIEAAVLMLKEGKPGRYPATVFEDFFQLT